MFIIDYCSSVYILTNCFAQFPKVGNKLFVVELVVNIEAVPQVAADDYAAKPQVLGNLNVVEVHAAHRVDLLVDKPSTGRLLQGLNAERLFVGWIRLAVEERFQKHVAAFPLGFLQFVDSVACSGHIAAIAYGGLVGGIVQVYSLQTIFFFQLEVVVNGDLSMIVF